MPSLRFAIPKELHLLARLLRAERPLRAEVHHLVGHDHALLGLFQRLNIPYEVIIHDYSWICPRISLIGPDKRYCGEPNVSQCDACVADAGSNSDEDITARHLRERSLVELTAATLSSSTVARRRKPRSTTFSRYMSCDRALGG